MCFCCGACVLVDMFCKFLHRSGSAMRTCELIPAEGYVNVINAWQRDVCLFICPLV